jgi:hypothetical protein
MKLESLVAALSALAASWPSFAPAAANSLLREERFTLGADGEVIASVAASCAGCSWGVAGREAAVLRLTIDGRYSQHLYLNRGAEKAPYRILIGALRRGPHRLRIELDRTHSARGAGAVEIGTVETEAVAMGDPLYLARAHGPILHARPNTIGRFTDVPLLMWVESEATARGTRLRYSVVFSNEDGGTPADRLMATWGRLTDIEYVYGIELDPSGRVLARELQGKNHRIRPFAGRRQGQHPLLYVVTDNNMVDDRGVSAMRLTPAPVPFDLESTSREALMDSHPWTYRVSDEEVRREGRVAVDAQAGSGTIPDPRRFAYLEACVEMHDTTVSFEVGLRGADGQPRWYDSSHGLSDFRIARNPDHFPNGCFRGAVALPEGASASDLLGLRIRAQTRQPAEGEPPLPPGAGSARLKRVNKLFLLGPDDLPQPSVFSWTGDVPLTPEGPACELSIAPES